MTIADHIDGLQKLADLAAQASDNTKSLPRAQQGDFARALLETSLALQRRHIGLRASPSRDQAR